MRQVDPGDLRRLPPSRTLSIGPPATREVLEGPPVEVGLPTWLLLCDLQLLGGPGPEKQREPVVRGSALAYAVPEADDLGGPLRALDEAVREARSLRSDAVVEDALRSLVEAFRLHGWDDAARSVAETWLWVQPENYAANLHAGILMGDTGRSAEAETLLARSVIIARQAGDWAAYCTAGVALGDTHRNRRDLDSAERIYLKVRSRARRHGVRSVLAPVAYGLFTVSAGRGDVALAEERAEGVLDLCPGGGETIRQTAAELARLWAQEGRHEDALRIFAGLCHASDPVHQAGYAASACLAAAGAGDREWFEWFWAAAWRWTYDESAREEWGGCLGELEKAATLIGDIGRAELARKRMGATVPPGAPGTSSPPGCGAAQAVPESSPSLADRLLARAHPG
jgi:tetratricopeptide (TPR) repeat protein